MLRVTQICFRPWVEKSVGMGENLSRAIYFSLFLCYYVGDRKIEICRRGGKLSPTIYIPIIALWIIIFVMLRNRRKAVVIKQMLEKRKIGGSSEMKELAERFIGKECIINAFDHQFTGVIKEVTDGAILVEKDGKLEAINLAFILRIREYPCNKNGKKKSVVLD